MSDIAINVTASLHSVKMDEFGESTIIFKCPQSDLLQILKLTQLTQQLLQLNITLGD